MTGRPLPFLRSILRPVESSLRTSLAVSCNAEVERVSGYEKNETNPKQATAEFRLSWPMIPVSHAIVTAVLLLFSCVIPLWHAIVVVGANEKSLHKAGFTVAGGTDVLGRGHEDRRSRLKLPLITYCEKRGQLPLGYTENLNTGADNTSQGAMTCKFTFQPNAFRTFSASTWERPRSAGP